MFLVYFLPTKKPNLFFKKDQIKKNFPYKNRFSVKENLKIKIKKRKKIDKKKSTHWKNKFKKISLTLKKDLINKKLDDKKIRLEKSCFMNNLKKNLKENKKDSSRYAGSWHIY